MILYRVPLAEWWVHEPMLDAKPGGGAFVYSAMISAKFCLRSFAELTGHSGGLLPLRGVDWRSYPAKSLRGCN